MSMVVDWFFGAGFCASGGGKLNAHIHRRTTVGRYLDVKFR